MQSVRIGASLRAIRIRSRLRQADVAARAGCSRALVSSVEAGRLDGVTLARLNAVGRAVGADVDIVVRWRGERIDPLLDAGHSRLVEATVRRLAEHGWRCGVETTFSVWGERGSIDVLATRAVGGAIFVLVVEVKTAFGDLQDTLATLDRKLRLAPGVAGADRGRWFSAGLLAVADTRTNRRVVETHATTFGVAFPVRGVAVRRWLRAPTPESRRMLMFLPDVTERDVRQRSRVRPRPDGASRRPEHDASRTAGRGASRAGG